MKETIVLIISGVISGFLITSYLREDPIDVPTTSKLVIDRGIDTEHGSIPHFHGPKILCWVATQPSNHQKKAIHIYHTWGSRCDKLLFMSSWNDSTLPGIVPLPVKEGRDNLWLKTKAALRYLRKHYFSDYDWFFKADDDTYAILENMRHMLEPFDPSLPLYMGCRFKPFHKQGYNSGGAGYLLSRAALEQVVDGLDNENVCPSDEATYEDVALGQCAANVGVVALDTRDEYERLRFLPYSPEVHMNPESMNMSDRQWLSNFVWTPIKTGMDCCSPLAVTFHYIEPTEMYIFDYLVYKLKAYGLKHSIKRLGKRKFRFSRRELQAR